jgi:hypothetical protein
MGTDPVKPWEPGKLPPELIGTWFRSFEEESNGDIILRAPSYSFPPTRVPRPALRLKDDGTATVLRGGPADRLEGGEPGRWTVCGATLRLETAQLFGEFPLVTVDPDRIVIRRPSVSTGRF